MTGKECDRVLDGLIVDKHGELVLDESFRKHLDECARCRAIYECIEAAKKEEVPNYVPAAMRRIRQMEASPTSVGWIERLRASFIFRPRVLVPAAVTVAIMIIALSLGLHLFSGNDNVNYIEMVSVQIPAEIGDVTEKLDARLDEINSNRVRLLYSDL